jgi:hypothetical protein
MQPHQTYIAQYMIQTCRKHKNLPNDTIQLLTKIINIENLLYLYANVMQQSNGSSCELFTITYAINIAFGLNLE